MYIVISELFTPQKQYKFADTIALQHDLTSLE